MESWDALQRVCASGNVDEALLAWNDAWRRLESPSNGYDTDECWKHYSYWNRLVQVGRLIALDHLGSSLRPTPEEIVERLTPRRDLAQPQSAGQVDYILAVMALDRGRPDLARAHNDRFVEALVPAGTEPDGAWLKDHRSRYVDAFVMGARIHQALGQTREGIFAIQELLRTLPELEASPGFGGAVFAAAEHSHIQVTLGSLLTELGATGGSEVEAARETLAAALTVAREAEAGSPGDQYAEPILTVLTRRAWLAIANDDHAAAREDLEEAARLSPAALSVRSRAFRAALQLRVAREVGPEEAVVRLGDELGTLFEELLALWRGGASEEGGTGYLAYGRTRFALCEYLSWILATRGDEAGASDALEFLIELQALGLLARDLGAPPTNLTEVRETLLARPGTGLVTFARGKDRVHVFAVSQGPVLHRELEILESDFEELVHTFHRELLTPGAPAEARAARLAEELYAALLPDELGRTVAAWERVFLVDREMLGGLAFEALRVDGAWLALRTPVSELPSLPVGVELARRAQVVPAGRTKHLDLYSDTPVPGLPQIPRLTSRASPSRRDRIGLLGGEATLDRVRAALEPGDVFVWTTIAHGVEAPATARSTDLALADEERLGIEDLARLPAPPVVVLGLCRGRAAMDRLGDSAAGHLGGAALRGGALAVVLSAHDLELHAHAEFEASFLRALDRGQATDDAFRAGLVALQDAGYGPSVWSRYTLLGLGAFAGPAVPENGDPRLLVGAAGAAVLALVLLLRRRARAKAC